MSNSLMKHAVAMGIASVIAVGAGTPSWAAPVLSSTAIVGATSPTDVIDVRYRGHRGRYYRGNGAGVALGVLGLVGAAAAASAYGNNYYTNQRHYGPGYGPSDGYGPSYGYGWSPYGGYDQRYDRY